ncbi:hypothetical protein ACE1CI_14460 [Aerosakkonemataceae cyanobacterium BLCC-F50]|uniref:Uncharacterized protein n=1 Tax=Floridaenema flaviceps BLCC-F50 TaxID=3153642 RepID=A0ABV4XT72_9CYAN
MLWFLVGFNRVSLLARKLISGRDAKQMFAQRLQIHRLATSFLHIDMTGGRLP